MNEHYFQVLEAGLPGELRLLSLEESLEHLDNLLSLFLLDKAVAGCYILDLARKPDLRAREGGVQTLAWLLEKHLILDPFDSFALVNLAQITGRKDCAARAELLKSLDKEPDGLLGIRSLHAQHDYQDTGRVLRTMLKAYPSYVQAADLLLHLDFRAGRAPGDWLGGFRCPLPLSGYWTARLFAHHALLGLDREALALWDKLAPALRNEHLENLAAELHLRQGDEAGCRALYAASLARDPRQAPVRLRLNELDNPSPLRPELLDQRDIAICLYSWNKAEMLAHTLESLAATDLGRARVRILLNGCTDGSLERVRGLLPLFGERDVRIVDLPINVGAPAARNWLAALPECREADYVAYIDDDVELPRHWLARLVSVLEEVSAAGIAGCKVVHPGIPSYIQYLFRNVHLTRPDLFKLSLDSPAQTTDSGVYDFTRRTMSVMGCCHVLRGKMLREIPGFDIRFSPSQVDDIDHDLMACLAGWQVLYCGLVTCVHLQNSGLSGGGLKPKTQQQVGNVIGNDLKFCCKHLGNLEQLREMTLEDRRRAASGADWRGQA